MIAESKNFRHLGHMLILNLLSRSRISVMGIRCNHSRDHSYISSGIKLDIGVFGIEVSGKMVTGSNLFQKLLIREGCDRCHLSIPTDVGIHRLVGRKCGIFHPLHVYRSYPDFQSRIIILDQFVNQWVSELSAAEIGRISTYGCRMPGVSLIKRDTYIFTCYSQIDTRIVYTGYQLPRQIRQFFGKSHCVPQDQRIGKLISSRAIPSDVENRQAGIPKPVTRLKYPGSLLKIRKDASVDVLLAIEGGSQNGIGIPCFKRLTVRCISPKICNMTENQGFHRQCNSLQELLVILNSF